MLFRSLAKAIKKRSGCNNTERANEFYDVNSNVKKILSFSHLNKLSVLMRDFVLRPVIDQINNYLPITRQVLMFSATMPNHIVEASRKYLNNPHKITIGKLNKAAPEIDQQFIDVKEEFKYIELDNQLSSKDGTVIVFVKTKRGADKLARNLKNLPTHSGIGGVTGVSNTNNANELRNKYYGK